jgi:hypothetical protein
MDSQSKQVGNFPEGETTPKQMAVDAGLDRLKQLRIVQEQLGFLSE